MRRIQYLFVNNIDHQKKTNVGENLISAYSTAKKMYSRMMKMCYTCKRTMCTIPQVLKVIAIS